ncbi:Fic family protein [Mucilaginibacter ginsenosidivorax]|uniref:Fic family protein n=1 Tax=Mucilaginibacter ginsenosidivorax TaxID=862126 RepID=A0A5B8W587_9SPHI|nr:Fic/DOC family N-terminal domain-containing protein [Mucilaginibacter ginsenosidivorax]QEC79044.1 Fic family protein [Mucilaginibacter ginsenosidivorax]
MPYDRTKPFNNLPLLPPDQAVENDIDIFKKLVTASRALAAVNVGILRLPNPLMLVNTIGLQEAQASTAIENIFTTEDELYKAVSDTVQEDRANIATKEVLRYREALWEGYRLIKEENQIDLKSITGIFRQIKQSSAGLRSPASLTVIQRGQSEFRAGEVIYTPPRGPGLIEKLMDNLLEYLNDDKQYPTDPLLKMCFSHYQFEAIHPFSDGNGRTGRILNLLYLVHAGLLNQPVLYLSKYIIVNKEDYYYNLGIVTQRGSWKPWILYMLDAVENTSHLTSQLINNIIAQMEATLIHAKGKIKWYSKEVNELIFSQPYIKPQLIGDRLGITSRTTLTKYFGELVDAKVLSPIKDGRETFYVNDDLVRILEN